MMYTWPEAKDHVTVRQHAPGDDVETKDVATLVNCLIYFYKGVLELVKLT